MKNIILLLTLLIVSNVALSQKTISLGNNKLPIVELMVNGKKVKFLLDTGASFTILANNITDDFNVKFVISSDDEVLGIGNMKEDLYYTNKLKITLDDNNTIIKNGKIKGRNIDIIINKIFNTYGESILGILGMDILTDNKCIIDFKRNILIFPFL